MIPSRLLAVALLVCVPAVTRAQDTPEPAPPPSIAGDLATYLEALGRATTIGGERDELTLQVTVYGDAWQQYVIERLRAGLEAGQSLEAIRLRLRKVDRKERKRREGKAGFSIALTHPNFKPDADPDDPRAVDFLHAKLPQAIRMTLGGKGVKWQAAGVDHLEPIPRLKVGKHNTVKNGRLVPFISPVKPKHARYAFTGRKARIEGVFSPKVLTKKGELAFKLTYEEMYGTFDDRHLINLNEPETRWNQGLVFKVSGPLPGHLPDLPRRVADFVASIDAAPDGE